MPESGNVSFQQFEERSAFPTTQPAVRTLSLDSIFACHLDYMINLHFLLVAPRMNDDYKPQTLIHFASCSLKHTSARPPVSLLESRIRTLDRAARPPCSRI